MTSIRIMTLNICGQPEDFDGEGRLRSDGRNPERWDRRGDLVVRVIRKYAPDLIGLQEVQIGHFEFLRDRLAEYASEVGLEIDEGVNAQHNSLFWRKDRFESSALGVFYFSRTPEVRSSDWDVPYPMGATWVRLRERSTGVELVHLNTTFEDGPHGERARVASAKLIAARTAQIAPDVPLIATADYNCNPGSPAHRAFMSSGFTDSYLAAGHVDEAVSTYHGFLGERYDARDPQFGGPTADPFWRVDWILTRDGRNKIRTQDCTVVRDAELPVYPSDHYPVLAELAVEPEPARD
jgi:endonuclease/exonuclease/phosphatase family metal-dependent hydrolase